MISKYLRTIAVIVLITLIVPFGALYQPQEVSAAGGSKQLIIGGFNDALSKVAIEYNVLQGGTQWLDDATQRYQLVSTTGTLSNLSIELSGVPGTNGYVFTLMKNGAATSLTCTVAADGTTAIDSVNTVAVVAGDYVSIRSSYLGAPDNTPKAWWSIQFEGDTANESLILGNAYHGNTAETRYAPLSGGLSTMDAVESNVYQIIPTNGTIKNLYIKLKADPGTAPDAYSFTLRVNEGDSLLTTTIIADNTTGNDVVHEISVSAGDHVALKVAPIDTPSTVIIIAWGMTFVSDTNDEFLILGVSSDAPTNSQTEYNSLNTTTFSNAWTTTEANVFEGGQVIDTFVLKNFYVEQSVVSGAGKSWDYTVRGGGGSTNLTINISGGADTTGSDTTHTYTPVAYDDLAIMAVPTGNPTAAIVHWGLVGYIPGIVAPTLTTFAATSVTYNSATGNGNITDTGGENPTVTFYWGTSDGVNVPANWDNSSAPSSPAQPQGVAACTLNLTNLDRGTTYYYNAAATNTAGTDWGTTRTFTTSQYVGVLLLQTLLRVVVAAGIMVGVFLTAKSGQLGWVGLIIGVLAFIIVDIFITNLI